MCRKIFFTILFSSLLCIGLLGWLLFGDHSSYKTGLHSYKHLPSQASDITVFRDWNISGLFVTDFQIAEPDFVAFATKNGWSLQSITNIAFISTATAFREGRPNDKKEITEGLFYSRIAGNGGGVTAAYDRKGGRAYIKSSAR